MNPIKVLLVEDDAIWGEGISRLLSRHEDIDVIGIAATKEEAMQSFQEADVITMDLNLTGNRLDGIELAETMSRIRQVKIIMLTALQHKEAILKSFEAGAVHYVSKSELSILPQVIRSIMYGGTSVEILASEYIKLQKNQWLACLTIAEREIMDLLEQDLSIKAIGEKLYKAESTIKNQVGSILKKLNVKTRKQALAKLGK